MKFIKNIIQNIKEYLNRSDIDVRERLFMLLAGIALIGMGIAFLMGLAIHENIESLLVVAGGLVFFSILVIVGYKIKRIVEISYVVAVVLVLVMMPINFFTSGGIHGGAALWNLFDALYIALILRGKPRAFFLGLQSAVVIAIYYVYYNYPNLIVQHSEKTAFEDSIASYLIIMVFLVVMVSFQTRLYIKENEKANQQSEEINELNRSQNRFFSSMSHEIRTPINTIIGLNEMILREAPTEDIKEDAQNIESAGKMLLHLINDILDMSKLESGKMDIITAPFDVADMISDVAGMIWVRAKEKGLKFSIDVAPDMPKQVTGDEVRIKQILINLLSNSVKYTNEGSVELAARCEDTSDPEITKLIFSITDTGIGIKKDSIPYLFDAFTRVDEENNKLIEGTGLGLSIVKQFIDLMGGNITVNSVYNVGSTFTVELPLHAVGDARININKAKGTSKKKYAPKFTAPEANILIVDDTPMNIKVVERLLKDTQVKITTASGGEQALEKTLETSFNVILMDHEMPGMNGIECFHKIKTQTGGHSKNARIVALTANAGPECAELYSREGFDGYIVKPVNSQLLEAEMIRLLPKELVTVNASELDDDNIGILWRDDHVTKTPVALTTDICSALPKELLRKNNIDIIPAKIKTVNGTFNDTIDITADTVIDSILDEDNLVAVKEVSVERFVEFFSEKLKTANEVIHISTPDGVGGSNYKQALEASKTFDSVTVIDVGLLSGGIGLLLLELNKCIKIGMNTHDILTIIEDISKHIKGQMITRNPNILKEGNLISYRYYKLSTAFSLMPVICFKHSRLKVKSLFFGPKKNAWSAFIRKQFKSKVKTANIDTSLLLVPTAGISYNDKMWIKEEINKWITFDKIIFYEASPIVAIYCGPGTYGLMYKEK